MSGTEFTEFDHNFRVYKDKPPEKPKEGDVLIGADDVLYYKTGKWHPWILPPTANPLQALAIYAIWLEWRTEAARISYVSAWSPSHAADKQGYLRALREAKMVLKMSLDLPLLEFTPKILGHVTEILEDGSTLIEAKLTALIETLGEKKVWTLLQAGLRGTNDART